LAKSANRPLHRAIAAGTLPAPGRTLTFIWGDEIAGSENWLKAHPDQAAATQYMFALDMTGEDTEKTGGTFLTEKQADPSAVWLRPRLVAPSAKKRKYLTRRSTTFIEPQPNKKLEPARR